ncbi:MULTISPECIES: anti-sigma factor [unclassified Streptomyces]|uniref:anti-sigma factor n=1 Tax=unclassified Streptomyces TaxID=2593676 RepID=UPI0022524929|nr:MULTISPECIES: anti-sigma factor [unclassified Streptomyces]MCX4993067.1 anti-sigma factor [Streptomyces sp. NBC_00568]MCX5001697.1 anti-sigma factor [Streptomyces sp. NBC_00638]
MTTTDLHTLTGAYALHALADDERERFERHAADCEACAQEVRELTAAAARLGLAVTASPDPALKDQVMRRITTVRQEGPRAIPLTAPRRAGARGRRPARWALAAVLAAAAALGGTAAWQHERAQDAQEQARQAERRTNEVAAVLAAPDAKARTATLGDGATGTVVVSKSRDQAVFIASRMARPPSGKVYQLWFADAGAMRSAGLMDPGRTTEAVLMEGSVDGASGMGITVEPAGGSAEPTSGPLALLNFPA